MDNIVGVFLMELLQQSPLLLAYTVAIFVALTYWRRYPTPCLLTMVAAGLMLTVAVLQTFFSLYLVQSRSGGDGTIARMGYLLAVIGIASSFLRALAFGLLLAAVFHGRGDRQAPPVEQS